MWLQDWEKKRGTQSEKDEYAYKVFILRQGKMVMCGVTDVLDPGCDVRFLKKWIADWLYKFSQKYLTDLEIQQKAK